MRFKYFSIALLAVCAILPARADNPLNIEGGDATEVGILITEIETGKVIADINSQVALTPASVMKTVTTASALSMLGTDYTFKTRVSLEGNRSSAKRDRWEGNLIIDASGDPTLGSNEFKQYLGFSDSIIAHVRKLGISEISGTVVIREDMPGAGAIPQWECEDIAWPYGAGIYDFNWAGNYVRVYPATGKTIPASDLKVTVKTSSDGSTDLQRGINSENLTVWASKKNASNQKWNVNASVPNPAEIYASMLKSRLNSSGIKVGSLKAATAPKAEQTAVYTHRSPSLAAICRTLMKKSDNLFAEGVLRAIRPGESRSKCVKAEKEYWTDKGVQAKYTIINDGSGLTRANRFSPRFITDILLLMDQSDVRKSFVECFPIAGVDGTLKSFLKDTPLQGRLVMKTGSVSSVQAYAGYLLDAKGNPTHTVVVMVNGFFCPRRDLRSKIEDFLLEKLN
ncbi:MAG: D-alanyl-D-alanine carboxypeptidase/D-alanyl-D-alanine-endopeptidase [Muribaculaceae bacterium]|nr:D-alanyl-D-alanine carboxypeptidase/D-alanyl-D-alanine-endopeptidase [Muribaculaceae bacterium]